MGEQELSSTPVESTESTQVEEQVEDQTDADIEFEDDSDEVDNTTTQAEQDQSKQEQQTRVETRRETRRERNSKYARARREGMLEALEHTNPYTHTKMESEEDLSTYQIMKEMEKKGLDPTSTIDFINYTKEQMELANKEANDQKIKQQQMLQENQARMNRDMKEFATKYPDVDLNDWLNNKATPKQNEVFSKLIRSGDTAINAYESVQELFNARTFEDAQKIAKQSVQNSMASTGSLTDGADNQSSVNINKMTKKEFDDYWKNRFGN